jgi:hypothetical protein
MLVHGSLLAHSRAFWRVHEIGATSLIVLSAGARPLTVASGRLARAPGIASEADVIPTLRQLQTKKKPPWWEPRWGDATECIAAARSLKLSNQATVVAAIGSTPSPANDLRRVRNYYAHRSMSTFLETQIVGKTLGLINKTHPDALVVAPTVGGLPLFESWASDLLLLAEAAVQ